MILLPTSYVIMKAPKILIQHNVVININAAPYLILIYECLLQQKILNHLFYRNARKRENMEGVKYFTNHMAHMKK